MIARMISIAGGALKQADIINVMKKIQQVKLSVTLFRQISLTARKMRIKTPIPTPQKIS